MAGARRPDIVRSWPALTRLFRRHRPRNWSPAPCRAGRGRPGSAQSRSAGRRPIRPR